MDQNKQDQLHVGGVARMRITVPTEEADKAIITGVFQDKSGRADPGFVREDNTDGTTTLVCYRHNAFVNQGLQALLDSGWADRTASRITHIGLSGDQTTVTGATTTIGTPNSIKATSNVSRTAQTLSGDQTWTEADVTWPIYKIGYLRGTGPTTVSNIIGGTGGAAPYDEPFTIDLTNISTWSLQMGIDVTATAS